jgi:hypothetical protein
MTAAVDTITITWWLEVGALAFAGGIAIGLGVSWLLVPQDPTAQADPSALSEWPPILGALRAAGKNETALAIANEAFDSMVFLGRHLLTPSRCVITRTLTAADQDGGWGRPM